MIAPKALQIREQTFKDLGEANRYYNELVRELQRVFTKLAEDVQMIEITPSTGTSVRRAKIQTGGVGVATISCKLLNVAGAETGSPITVYPVRHLGSNALTGDVHPKLGNADIISVFQDLDDAWRTTFVFADVCIWD